jgi:hypothetical protein
MPAEWRWVIHAVHQALPMAVDLRGFMLAHAINRADRG